MSRKRKQKQRRQERKMSKPIYFTKQMKREVLAEFAKSLESMNFMDGKIKYETSYYWPKDKDKDGKEIEDFVTVIFSKQAKEKQDLLVREFSTEVGWHGVVRRDAEDPKTFWIDDIIVFPQKVSGSTVTPDQEAYATWLMRLPDEQFNHCRYHGHSHVNMATSPSGTDNQFQLDTLKKLRGDGFAPEEQAKFMEQLGDTAFYIFMIWNKKGEFNVRVYDMMNNRYYTDKEVHVQTEDEHTWGDFLQTAKGLVTTSYAYSGYQGGAYSGAPRVGSQTQICGFHTERDDDHTRYPSEYGYGYFGY